MKRRLFIQTTAWALGAGSLGKARSWSPVQTGASDIRYDAKTEALAKLIHLNDRKSLPMALANSLKQGTGPNEIMDVLFLDSVRMLQPHWYLGGEMHALIMTQSFYLLARERTPAETIQAVILAADYYKKVLEIYYKGNYTVEAMQPIELEPSPAGALERFDRAMADWDIPSAEKATASVLRAGQGEVLFQRLLWNSMRDFRNIGHKVIFTSNAHRVLSRLPKANHEPVFRSLVYGLLLKESHETEKDLATYDKYWRENQERAARFPQLWQKGQLDQKVTRNLLDTLRQGDGHRACEQATQAILSGCGPQSIWDAVFCGSAEILMRKPKEVVSEHAVTSANSYYNCFETATSDALRKLILLQAVARVTEFIKTIDRFHQGLGSGNLLELQERELAGREPQSLLDVCKRERKAGMELTLSYARSSRNLNPLLGKVGSAIVASAQDIHDFKYGWSVFEDLGRVSTNFRPYYLAGVMAKLKLDRDPVEAKWKTHPHKFDRNPEIDQIHDKAIRHALT